MRNSGNNLQLTVNNLTVSYTDAGPIEAPAIIFIHGFPFNKSMWAGQVDALKDRYRLIAYDVRGHGDTDAGKEDFAIELFVNDLLSLMDALKLDRATLCGLSMGGYIALNAVINYPKRFDALILSDTQCAADTPEAKAKRVKTIESIHENGVEKYAEESLKNLFAPESFTTKEKEIATIKEMILKTPEQVLSKTLLALSHRKETCSKLHEIKTPTLILVGEADKITPPAAARLMHEKIPHSLLSIIKHAGHLANLEDPAQFNDHLKQFLHRCAEQSFGFQKSIWMER
ncbi:MAG: alpha/beta fold hydrolase [Saprospiraceae bacterium]|nr:alpha/beta fold hydrolase [Saprospiraceae bacterium]